jgi:hypothetical protein
VFDVAVDPGLSLHTVAVGAGSVWVGEFARGIVVQLDP